MLLVGALLLSFSMSAWAQKVSLNFRNTKVETVLSSIKKQTGMEVVFSDQILNVNRMVSIRVTGVELTTALNKLLAGTNVSYEIRNNRIYFVEKKETQQSSQKKRVKGKVTDSTGEPIIGANIMEEGTSSNGTITDLDGNFELDVASNATLKVTYIGYRTQQVAVKGRSSLAISLADDTEVLDEVVVVGYGSMRKRDLTGAVGMVGGKDLQQRHTTTISTALQGAVAGVQVTRSGGAPESNPTIRVRGITTMSTNDPLVIVDGTVGNIDAVNPEDVENMTILKDAASASIYGARAAAGVILITTKRAKENDLKMSYNFEFGLDYIPTHPRTVGPERIMELSNEQRYNDNPTAGMFQTYEEDYIKNYRQLNRENPDQYPIVEDWFEEVFNKVGPKHSHTFNISGGSKYVKTNATLSYDKVNAMYDNRDYERIMMRVNNTFTINKYIGADLDFNFKHDAINKPYQTQELYEKSITAWPIHGAYYSDGRLAEGRPGGGDNPLACIYESGSEQAWNTTIGGRASLYVTPLDGLKLSAIVAPRYVFNKKKVFQKAMPYTLWDDPNTIAGYRWGYKTTNLDEERNDFYDITAQFIINYMKRFGKHDINVMGGYEGYYTKYESLKAGRDQYLISDFPYLDMGPTALWNNAGSATEQSYRSWFGRIAYSYADRYLIQANIRRDGSSRFHKDHRWGNFPSFSAGWVVSEEPFMKNAGWDWLSYLKLRGSWGILGNERISGNYYPYQAAINFSTALFYQNGGVLSSQSASQWAYAVQDLTWEKTASTDIGVDINFFDNRLRFTGEWFQKKTSDMLLAMAIPGYVGFDDPQRNSGKMETKGYELSVNWSDQVGDFSYSVGFNFSDAVSEMTDLGGTEFLGDKVKMEGSEFDEWYGYVSDGLILTPEDLEGPVFDKTQQLGSVKYKDISGPDGVPDGKISPEYDRVLLGGSQPRFLYGGNVSLAYKNLDFSMAFQGVGKQLVKMHNFMWENRPYYADNHWSPYNTDEQNAAVRYPVLSEKSKSADHKLSDFWLFNGRYFRMKNITVGWTLPKNWTEKILLNSARVYVAGNDLFCISKYPEGWDPETPASGSVLPVTSSVIFGLQVNF